ncbi:probable serine/threonine-protein kinase PBL19 isoform X2 [Miscanthus floridulus]|uniref:probable serine/threonine-protein kinase PBL19 isoform X2 n=1 Tax=Miscanthus floridulus TaxID=154761 RepID=UPI00345AB484
MLGIVVVVGEARGVGVGPRDHDDDDHHHDGVGGEHEPVGRLGRGAAGEQVGGVGRLVAVVAAEHLVAVRGAGSRPAPGVRLRGAPGRHRRVQSRAEARGGRLRQRLQGLHPRRRRQGGPRPRRRQEAQPAWHAGPSGHKQWLAEVQFLGVLEHPNLVKLLGYCAVDSERGAQRLLVYEFMPNKSLEDHLFRRANPPLSWNRRLQVILGAAEGLAYLHEGVEVQVIYRDFKTSNILLDKDFRAKLSDFGLAREGPTGANTHVSTAVVGTQGYAAPEYIDSGHLTAKSDVWSFGVVLYEILTGRRSLDRNKPAGEQKLLEWVVQFPPDSRNFRVIMDPRLLGEYSVKAAREIAKLADSCLLKNAKERPTMSEVVEVLRRAVQAHAEPDSRTPGGPGAKGKKADAATPSRR